MKANDNTNKHLQAWIEAVQDQEPTKQQSDYMHARLMVSISQQPEAGDTHQVEKIPTTSLWIWIKNLSTGPKLGFAASIALVCVLSISVVMSTSVVAPAFAAVKKGLAQVTSMYYKGEMLSNGKATMQIEVYHQSPSKLRIVTKPMLDGRAQIEVVNIFDISKGQGMTLMPHANIAFPIRFTPNVDVSNLEQDPRSWINKVLEHEGKVTKLQTTQINGIPATGYLVKEAGMTITLWINGATKLPVRITVESPKVGGVRTFVFEANMKFNLALDAALFDLTPSSEYRIMNGDE
jgi:outer membrane lipoprotein-sorting protein